MKTPTRPGDAAAAARNACSSVGVAGADDDEVGAKREEARQRREQKVEPLLLGEPADHAEEHATSSGVSMPKRSFSARLFCRRRPSRAAVKVAARCGSVAGFQTASSMPFRMPETTSERSAQQPVERHAALRRADLGGVGRRDGRDAIGELQPGLQEADAAEILDAVDRRAPAAGACRLRSSAAGKCPWKARLCTVITVAGRAPAAVVEIGRREPRLPVMRVHDVRAGSA